MTNKDAAYSRSGTAASLGAPVAHKQQLQVQPIIGELEAAPLEPMPCTGPKPQSGAAASLGAPVAHEQQLQAQLINPPMTSKDTA